MMIQNEGRDISKHHLDDRATSTSCALSCRHDASRPARLAPRRPTLDVSIGACSRAESPKTVIGFWADTEHSTRMREDMAARMVFAGAPSAASINADRVALRVKWDV